MVEGGDQDPLGRIGLGDDFEHALDESGRLFGKRLDLDIDQPIQVAGQTQGLRQGWDADEAGAIMLDLSDIELIYGIEGSGRAWPALVVDEPRAGVEGSHFREVEIGDPKAIEFPRVAREPRGDVGGPRERFIVKDDRDTIPG